jgi:hypothetical protein
MKRIPLVLLTALCASPLLAGAQQHIIPAGSLVGCTVAEPKISSKTMAKGDPVLCQVGTTERYGRSVLPYNSYLEGRFEDYKDPGHFVGKGWMVLKFDRMVIEPNTVIPVNVRVVDVPGYKVDNQGRILGKGHAKRDVALWSIPILWPVDLLMLPMRGPRPVLKEETHVTLKVMDDLAVPESQGPTPDQYGLYHRDQSAEMQPPPAPYPDQQPAPEQSYAAPDPYPQAQPYPQSQPDYSYAPPQPDYSYVPPVVAAVPAPPVYAYGYGSVGIAVGPGVYGYGYGGGYGYRGYAYAPPVRAYGYAPAPRAYGYGIAPRAYGYGGATRSYAYAGAGVRAPMGYGGGRGGMVARGGAGGRGGGRR